MNNISELKALINKNWQKICTTEDWSDPAFIYVLENIFLNKASYHRKQWEFIVIFICLYQQNKLNGDSKGASFGAGKEPLIYRLLPYVKSFLASDLYSWNTGWETAKMGADETPLEFLKRNTPKLVSNLDNLDAKEMDMRHLEMDDSSLDFCYSSCAFEHIGHYEDFVQHLKEVKRVLKEDGVYVMTTEFLFSHKTIETKGNYKFDIDYLKDLFIKTGFDTLEVFDAGCQESRINSPRPFVRPLVGSENLEKILPVASILDIEGVPYTSCCFILKPSKSNQTPVSFSVNGLKQSSSFVNDKINNNIMNLYKDKRE
jgi:SAM-dependent methyltransferase